MLRVLVASSAAVVMAAGYLSTPGLGQAVAPVPAAPARAPAAFGTAADVAFASTAWRALLAGRMVGPNRLMAYPVKSEQPHGNVVQIVAGTIKIAGRSTRVIVKNNHRGADLTPAIVNDDPQKHLADMAVMIKREKGYDPAHADWFWAVYKPDGSLAVFKSRPIAGRVDTGGTDGCIGCHVKYGGKDLETLTSR